MGRILWWTIAVVALIGVGVVTSCSLSNLGREGTYGTFVAQGGGAEVEILTKQRMPDSFGGEEYVYARFRSGEYRSEKLDIDINGRFRDTVRVDLSREGRWARIYLAIEPPVAAETTWVLHGDGNGHYLMPVSTADPVPATALAAPGRAGPYRWSVFAYVDFATGTHIRWPFTLSTEEERRTLLTKFVDLPAVQTIRGTRIEWAPTTKR